MASSWLIFYMVIGKFLIWFFPTAYFSACVNGRPTSCWINLAVSDPLCVCVTGHQSVDCVRIMRWWISNFRQLPLPHLVSVAYCYIAILDPPRPPFPLSDVLTGGGAPSWPNTPSTDVLLVSAQDHPPTCLRPSIPILPCLSHKTHWFLQESVNQMEITKALKRHVESRH